MKYYKVKKFAQEAKKLKVMDEVLGSSLAEFLKMDPEGQQRYALGAGLYKLRLSTQEGRGKSGGSRSILAFKTNSRVIWLHI